MEREFVALEVQRSLVEAEAGVESALSKTTALLARLYEAKRELGLAAPTGAEETERVGRAIAALQTAHGELVGTHHGLSVLARALSLRTKMLGWKPISSVQRRTEEIAAA